MHVKAPARGVECEIWGVDGAIFFSWMFVERKMVAK